MNSGLRLFPEEASTQAPATDTLFLILMIVSAAIITLVVTLIITFSLRYRRGTNANRGPLRDLISREFEIGWTAGHLFSCPFPVLVVRQHQPFNAYAAARRDGDPRRRQAVDVEDPARQRRARNQYLACAGRTSRCGS